MDNIHAKVTLRRGGQMASQSIRLLYCYLREKWTTLGIIEGEAPNGSGTLDRVYQCLGIDATCHERRCRLSGDEMTEAQDAQDPWFDE